MIWPRSDEAEHRAYAGGLHAAVGAMRDRLVEQRQRVAHRAFGGARDQRQRVRLDRDALACADRRRDDASSVRPRCGLQIEAQAARAHRDRHFLDLGRREQEFDVFGRLFERLQQAVEGRFDSMCTSSMM